MHVFDDACCRNRQGVLQKYFTLLDAACVALIYCELTAVFSGMHCRRYFKLFGRCVFF